MANTPKLALPYPVNTDPLANMAAAMQSLATALDNKLIQHRHDGNRLDAATTAGPSQPNGLTLISGRVAATISGGLLNFTFPGGGFPNGIIGFSAMTVSGTPAAPVVNGGNLTRLGGQLFIMGGSTYGSAGGLNGAVVVSYLALGF